MKEYCTLFFLILSYVFFGYVQGVCAKNDTSNFNKKFNLDLKDLSSEQILMQVEEKTGYKVISECINPVSNKGRFTNISIEDFFSRIFKGMNSAVLIDDTKHIIRISCFDKEESIKHKFVKNRKVRSNSLVDSQTGLPWEAAEKAMGLGGVGTSKLTTGTMTNFVVSKRRRQEIEKEIGQDLKTDLTVLKKERQTEDQGEIVLIDHQTGLPWEVAEKAMGLDKSNQFQEATHTSESKISSLERKKNMRAIEKEIGNAIKSNPILLRKERQNGDQSTIVLIDSQTGLPWKAAERAMGLSGK